MSKSNKKNESWSQVLFGVILGGIAIFAIKAIFENDKSKIISKKGYKFLSDDDKMKKINVELKKLETSNKLKSHQEIIL